MFSLDQLRTSGTLGHAVVVTVSQVFWPLAAAAKRLATLSHHGCEPRPDYFAMGCIRADIDRPNTVYPRSPNIPLRIQWCVR